MLSPEEAQKKMDAIVGEVFDKGYECGYKAAIEDVGRVFETALRVFETALMDSLNEKDTKPC